MQQRGGPGTAANKVGIGEKYRKEKWHRWQCSARLELLVVRDVVVRGRQLPGPLLSLCMWGPKGRWAAEAGQAEQAAEQAGQADGRPRTQAGRPSSAGQGQANSD